MAQPAAGKKVFGLDSDAHFPHWTPPHDIYAPEMTRQGITVAYDGMRVELTP